MKIGTLKIKNPFFLAPMHQVNDIAFRELCMKNGCGLSYTWLLHPLSREKFLLNDKPAVQIATQSEKGVREFIEKNDGHSALFDLNLGCPACKAKDQDYGAYLQKNPAMVEKILKAMKDSTDHPVTVKIRKSPHIPGLIKIFERYCDAIAIHPRTAEQGYSGIPDIGFAEKLKARASIPIIYSGDADENNAVSLLEKFDFVMIGRKAIGNPGIFAHLSGKKPKGSFSDYLKLAQRYSLEFQQIRFQALNFTKGRENAGAIRKKLSFAREIDGLREIMGAME